MHITSRHWNEELGICEKHLLPSVPCPACLAGDGDEALEFHLSDTDIDVLAAESLPARCLIPANIKNPTFY